MSNNSESGGIGQTLKGRAALIELLVVAVFLALAIGILASGIADRLTSNQQIALGLFMSTALVLIIAIRIIPRSHNRVIQGFVLVDNRTRRLLAVPGYDLAQKVPELLEAAFIEN